LHYYAKIQVVTGVAAGIITGGLSTFIGVGTFASHVADAKGFVSSLWQALDVVSNEPGISVSKQGFEDSKQSSSSSSPALPPKNGSFSQNPPQYPQQTSSYPQQTTSYSVQQTPANLDVRQIPTEQLEKLLQYHKEMAWQLEREIQERRNQQPSAPPTYPPQQQQQQYPQSYSPQQQTYSPQPQTYSPQPQTYSPQQQQFQGGYSPQGYPPNQLYPTQSIQQPPK